MKVAAAPLLAGTDIQAQIDLETTSVQAGVVRYRKLAQEATRRGRAASLKPVERLVVAWLPRLAEEIRKFQRAYRAGKMMKGIVYWGPLSETVPAYQMALIALDKTLGFCLSCDGPANYTSLSVDIGAAVAAQANLMQTKRELAKTAKTMEKREARRARARLDNILDRSDAIDEINRLARKNHPLPVDTLINRASLGEKLLYTIAREVALLPYEEGETDPDEILAFKVEMVERNRRPHRVISLRDKTLRIIEDGHQARQRLRPVYLPMIVPPYRRDRSVPGGYIIIRTPFVTKSTREQQEAYRKADLSFEYDALTALGSSPHTIMQPVADVVMRLADEGGGLLGVPPARDDLKPERPVAADTDPEVEKSWKRDAAKWHDQRVANKAARESFSQLRYVADLMGKYDDFYFPHNNDYRGRVYPIPQYLNHQGPDICRGMLAFSRPVDPDMKWLYIHAANCAGFDKESFDVRAQWAKDWIADHSARKWIGSTASILDHIDEWGNTEEIDSPWQFLASLVAIHDKQWGARLPVQIDGSCNGLQHYAALTRDETLADIVNLRPSEKPNGIYLLVAGKVGSILRTETNPLAAELIPLVDKAVVKQVVMTTVYGVTFAGAREQIRNRLAEKGVPADKLFAMSHYLAGIVIRAIEGLCGRASQAMGWIRECAGRLVDEGHPFALTTPTGLPLVQSYRKSSTKKIKVMDGCMNVLLDDSEAPLARAEHIRGSAPNTIHGIDQAHMKRVGVEAVGKGIDCSFVHDGFRAHSGNIEGRGFKPIVHRQFAELHETDWLAMFHAEWLKLVPDMPPPPERGRFDPREVINAAYAFH